MEDVEIITKYVAAWAWHLTAIIFLSMAAVLMAIGNLSMSVGFALAMGISEFMALKRKRELNHEAS